MSCMLVGRNAVYRDFCGGGVAVVVLRQVTNPGDGDGGGAASPQRIICGSGLG